MSTLWTMAIYSQDPAWLKFGGRSAFWSMSRKRSCSMALSTPALKSIVSVGGDTLLFMLRLLRRILLTCCCSLVWLVAAHAAAAAAHHAAKAMERHMLSCWLLWCCSRWRVDCRVADCCDAVGVVMLLTLCTADEPQELHQSFAECALHGNNSVSAAAMF